MFFSIRLWLFFVHLAGMLQRQVIMLDNEKILIAVYGFL